MKLCNICGIVKKKTFICKRCNAVVCLSCFDFTYWLCATCRELKHDEEYSTKKNEVVKITEESLGIL